MTIYYADINNSHTLTGVGSSVDPFNTAQVITYVGPAQSVDEDIFKLSGTFSGSYNYLLNRWNKTISATSWEDGVPWILSASNFNYMDPAYFDDKTINVINGIFNNVYIQEQYSTSISGTSFIFKNCIFYEDANFDTWQTDLKLYFYGCTFVSANPLFLEYGPGSATDEIAIFEDCVFIDSIIDDDDIDYGTISAVNCVFTESEATISANISATMSGTGLLNCEFDWDMGGQTYPDMDNISESTILFDDYNLTNTSASRSTDWVNNDYDIGLWNTTRLGAGVWNFDSTTYTVDISANTNIAFFQQDINFDITVTPSPTGIVNYGFDFGNNQSLITTASSATYSYLTKPALAVSGSFSAGANEGIDSLILTINPLPIIETSGNRLVGEDLLFTLSNLTSFITTAISSVEWNFGDGSLSSLDLTATPIHTYSAVGNYTAYASATDISGAYGVGSINIGIFESDLCELKSEYIELGGPVQVARYGSNKFINLTNFLPSYVKQTDTSAFLGVFENYLNEMFAGESGYNISAEDLTINKDYIKTGIDTINDRDFTYDLGKPATSAVSSDSYDNAQEILIGLPDNYLEVDKKISILEKIKRLTDLQDSDLIPIKFDERQKYSDFDFISLFAKNLGYQVDMSRGQLQYTGDITDSSITEDNTFSATDIEKYLRFSVASLPEWYKIKTTADAIKVMLFSFGLIGNLNPYYTEDYINNWLLLNTVEGLSNIPDDYYATPHFAVEIDVDAGQEQLSFDDERRQNVINAIESVRPINTVFEHLAAIFRRSLPPINIIINTRITLYTYIQ